MTTWSLRNVRTEVRGQLRAAGINAASYWPDRVNPPVAIIDGGEPYLDLIEDKTFKEEGQEFHAKATVRLEMTLVAGIGDTEVMRDNLDDLLCKSLVVVSDASRAWNIERISQPFQLTTGNAFYLSIRVTMTTEFDLEEV